MSKGNLSCDGCGKPLPDLDPVDRPQDTADAVAIPLCLGCALSFAVHESNQGRPHPYV